MRILVADADLDHRTLLVNRIQELGHTVQEALVGKEIVALCRKKCPDLLLIDTSLATPSALEVIKQIRQLGGMAVWNPIVLMGQEFSDADVLNAIEAGADDCLTKPLGVRLDVKIRSAQRHQNLKEEVFTVAHDLVVANRALESRVTQDVMTGIANFHTFEETFEREWFKAKRANYPLALILLNLDFFQNYNQAYGAVQGDECIKKIAEALKGALPKTADLLARTISETFAVILSNTGRDEAMVAAEQLHAAIDALKIPHIRSGCSDHVTASFGVSVVERDQFTQPAELKEAADYALYQAKHYGRNRIYYVPAIEPATTQSQTG